MVAADVQRAMYRGNTLQFVVQVLQVSATAPPGVPPVPVNIAGWTAYCTVKYQWADYDLQAVWQGSTAPSSVPAGGSVSIFNAAVGEILVSMPAGATLLFPDSDVDVVYDVTVFDLSGNKQTVERGTITVSPVATRATS